jgi:hypothetical protein
MKKEAEKANATKKLIVEQLRIVKSLTKKVRQADELTTLVAKGVEAAVEKEQGPGQKKEQGQKKTSSSAEQRAVTVEENKAVTVEEKNVDEDANKEEAKEEEKKKDGVDSEKAGDEKDEKAGGDAVVVEKKKNEAEKKDEKKKEGEAKSKKEDEARNDDETEDVIVVSEKTEEPVKENGPVPTLQDKRRTKRAARAAMKSMEKRVDQFRSVSCMLAEKQLALKKAEKKLAKQKSLFKGQQLGVKKFRQKVVAASKSNKSNPNITIGDKSRNSYLDDSIHT